VLEPKQEERAETRCPAAMPASRHVE